MNYTLNIVKASNGWIVAAGPLGNPDNVLLVNAEENLGGTIAAALVAGRLSGTPSDKTSRMTTGEIDDLIYEKSKWEAERRELMDELRRKEYAYQQQTNQMAANLAAPIWGNGLANSILGQGVTSGTMYEALRNSTGSK